jgi:AcrR family transcriptional regulator
MFPPDESGGRSAGSPSPDSSLPDDVTDTPETTDATDATAETDSHEALMRATYRALCEHGYADLTMADIAREADRSTSLLHYHYDTKEGLLVAFLDYLFDEFGDAMEYSETDDPVARLETLIDRLLSGPAADEGPFADAPPASDGFHTAMLELRAQAPYVPAYREAITGHDDYLHALTVEILEAGMDAGVFHERNPDVVAATLLAAARGDRVRSLVLGDDSTTDAVRQGIEEFVLADLLVADAAERFGDERFGDETADTSDTSPTGSDE